jgi:hypothetical protein
MGGGGKQGYEIFKHMRDTEVSVFEPWQ